jgi:carbonic anhydrase
VVISQKDVPVLDAKQALKRLIDGNARFVQDERDGCGKVTQARRDALVSGQNPQAIILGCSDSRVPAELIFDQGLGDLFVIRVAGNIVAPSQVGSVEFAAQRYGTPLVVVLGHSNCGAILATLEDLEDEERKGSPNVNSIVSRIRPSLEDLLELNPHWEHNELVHRAVRANIRASANHLRHASQTLENLIQQGRLLIVGAEYSLETGVVEFFDGMPDDLQG